MPRYSLWCSLSGDDWRSLAQWVATLDLVFDDSASERQKVDEIKKQITKRVLGAAG